MNHCITWTTYLLLVMLFACKKNNNRASCLNTENIYRTLTNKNAIVKLVPNGNYYIVEQGTNDVKLFPCNLAEEYKVNNLNIIVSGNVAFTPQVGPEPCCIENFEISAISK